MAFYTIYTREAHPIEGRPLTYTWDAEGNPIEQPDTFEERLGMAGKTVEEASVSMEMLIDEMDDPVYCSYGAMPNSAFLIGMDGWIVLTQAWSDPQEMKDTLLDYLGMQLKGLQELSSTQSRHQPTIEASD